MSKLKYVDISAFRPAVGDVLVIRNTDDFADSMLAKVLEVQEDTDDAGKYLVQIMRTTKSFIAGTKLVHVLDRTKGPVIGAVVPADGPEDTGFDLDASLEEITLYHLITLARPFAQQGKKVRLGSAVDYLRAHDVVGENMTNDRVKALIRRAIALRPDKIQLNGGWIAQQHVVPAANTVTPKNMATTERVVDKQRLTRAVSDFVVNLCESGVFGPIAWKVE